ncbi:MAG: BTAD domain-containing putative transcriptional regulator, partial [Solirubrobacteraceae bacterium]
RLDDPRLAAIEERDDADLAFGRHHELIAELEGHISRNPLRERPRCQLMLALYRAGRQAEALRAYQDARRTLVEQVGIEPGSELRELERAILNQDPALDLAVRPGRPARPPARNGGSRRTWALAALALVALAGVGLSVALLAGGDSDAPAVATVRAGSVVAIDLKTNRITEAVQIGGTPTSVSVGEGGVWVLNADRQTVSRIDPRTRAVRTFGTGSVPTDLSAGAGALWVANGDKSDAQFVGPLATTISNIDPDSSAIRARVRLPRRPGATSNANGSHIAVTPNAVWVVNPDFSVSRIDPRGSRIAATVRSTSAVAVAAGDEGVWALNDDDSLTRLDRRRAGTRVQLATNGLSAIAVGAGAVWATAPYDGILWRVDTEPRVVQRTIPVGVGASFVTVGGGAVWVVNALRGTVSRLDPVHNRVVRTIELGGTPRAAAVGDGTLWVSVAGGDAVPSASAAAPGIDALPADTCGRVFYGGKGKPDRLIVSDMPLRGGPGLPTQQMSQAIAFTLRQRGFRAGRFRIAYQSCDDSTAQTGIFDAAKCAANAKAFAAKRTVIGVIGPFNSGCAVEQIPIAGRAAAGPLAMVSPTNSDVGLTRTAPNSPEGGLRALYPTGRRNYARLFPTEAAQGAANALLARAHGARRVVVLSDGGYGEPTALYFGRAARAVGLRVTARRWNPKSAGYRALAADAARSRPGAVFVSGLLDTNGGAVIKALRAALPPGVTIIANDGFLPISALFRSAGAAAKGVLVSHGGLPVQALGPEGRNFVTEFAATLPDRRVQRASVYAAAATVTLLDAIAGSDGTRSAVTRGLLDTRGRRGILGSFAFDANGDVVPSPITIVRARRGGGADIVDSTDGATLHRVIRPSRSLVH